ncbi:MAG: ABC transporter permease [Dehalococcoidales bacterium]|nr:ABC transporter permease [Dehalococcoidales bacterium]
MPEIAGIPEPIDVKARRIAKTFLKQENAVLVIVLIALIGGMGVATHGLTSSRANMMNVLLQSAIRGIASVGQAFVILTAGIDLSVGGIGLCASILGSLMMTGGWQNILGHPISVGLGILVMLLVGLGWGSLNGAAVSRIGMPALIVTLAIWQITKGAAFHMSSGRAIGELPQGLAFFGIGRVAGVPVPVIIFIAVCVVAYFILNHTTYGRSVYATGGNPVSAWLSGINVKKVLFSVYAISGFLAGLAGVIMTSRVMSTSMRTLEGLELDSIAAVVIGGASLVGGRGSLIGVVLGVLILGVINNGMSVMGADPATVGIVKGVIIFAAVAIDYLRRRH